MAHTINTKYNPATGKITAKCWRKTIRVDGYYTKTAVSDLAAHKEAAQELVNRISEERGGAHPWVIIAEAEGIKANEYTFIIQVISQPREQHEYNVTFEIGTKAASYESAAKWVKDTYFKQGMGEHFEVKRKIDGWAFDRHPVEVDFIGG